MGRVAIQSKGAGMRGGGWTALVLLGVGARVAAADPAWALATDLFAESNWPACRIECARVRLEHPSCSQVRLLDALAGARQGEDPRPALRGLADDPAGLLSVTCAARYEWARAAAQAGDGPGAFEAFRQVAGAADEPAWALRAACSLALLLAERPDLARANPALIPQLRTLRALYTPELLDECRLDHPRGGGPPGGGPGQWLIACYRSQIRPALGERCSLAPSCSEYARQAFAAHGVLAVPLAADRFVREPGVVAAGERIVEREGRRAVADPLADHDFWWRP